MSISENYFNETRCEMCKKKSLSEALSGRPYDKANGFTAVSIRCPYVIDGVLDDRAKSTDGVLTDGDDIGGSIAEEKIWAGVKADEGAVIRIDLKKKYDSVCSFAFSCVKSAENAIEFPEFIEVLADGADVGRMYAPTDEKVINHNFVLSLGKCVNASEVSFVLPAKEGVFYRFEEASVYANEIITAGDFYGGFEVAEVNEELWDDQTDVIENLAVSKKLMVKAGAGGVNSSTNHSNIEILNDGVSSESTYCYDGKWVRFNGAADRLVVVDLGKTSAVTSFETHFLFSKSMWINIPHVIRFSLSEDGRTWYDAVKFEELKHNGDESMLPVKYELKTPVKARYASLFFTCDQNFVDEFIVNGKKSVKGAASAASLGNGYVFEAGMDDKGYLKPSEKLLGGAKDVLLVYHTTETVINENMLLPYVGYLDKDGNIKDTMFDGFLFLPSVRPLPGGGCPDGGRTFKTDWEFLFDSIFGDGICMNALEATAEKVAKALDLKDFKVKAYVTIANVHPEVNNFGEVDGKMLDFSSLDDCKKAAEWYVDKVRTKFKSMNYKHIELCGYYWFSEQLSGKYAGIVKAIADQIHSMGEQFFWIPWHCAPGFASWESYGFDVCCMQPNYAFNVGIPEKRLLDNDALVRRYGLCYEMECWGKLFKDRLFLRKYMNYMKQGAIKGYCDAINMYYQDVADFKQCCYSKDAPVRLMYDYQYKYMRNELPLVPERPADASFEAKKNTPLDGSVSSGSDIRVYRLSLSPEHGTVTLDENGSFTYYPNKNYTGRDSFAFRANEYLCDSEDAVVTVEVK